MSKLKPLPEVKFIESEMHLEDVRRKLSGLFSSEFSHIQNRDILQAILCLANEIDKLKYG